MDRFWRSYSGYKIYRFPFFYGRGRRQSLETQNDKELNVNFLHHFLVHSDIPSAGYSRHYKFLKELKIPLPPLPEQKRIATILDKADDLRRKRRDVITLLDTLIQSIFIEMFGDPKNVGQWNVKTKPLIKFCTKITDGTHQSPNWSTDGIPFIFVSNIRNQNISFDTKKFVSLSEYERLTKSTKVEAGDVLYTSVGSYGNSAVVPEGPKFIFQRHVAQLKLKRDELLPEFLSYGLETPILRAYADRVAKGVAQKTVTLTELKKMPFPDVDINVQREFVSKVSGFSNLFDQADEHKRHLDLLFTSLQSRAFSGEL